MNSRFDEDVNKNPEDLEREVGEQRSEIQETLTALAQRFLPSEVIDQVLHYTRHGGGDFSHSLMDKMRSNPLPALLTATGLAWMLFGQNRSQDPSRGYLPEDDVPARASYGVDPDYDPRVAGGTSTAAGIRQQAGGGIERLLREQPLAIGAIGLALGALVGASLPRSRQEDELLGETGERLRDKAARFAESGYAKAENVADEIKKKTH